MGRTYRRGESFPLVPHGRRSAVRPQLRSGCAVFSVGFVLAILAITMIRRAGTRVETNRPTTAIVENGPHRFTRNPIYICMFLGPGRSCDGLYRCVVRATSPVRCARPISWSATSLRSNQLLCASFDQKPAKLIRGMTGYGTGRGPGAAFPITALAPTASVASAAVDASTARHNRPHRSSCLST